MTTFLRLFLKVLIIFLYLSIISGRRVPLCTSLIPTWTTYTVLSSSPRVTSGIFSVTSSTFAPGIQKRLRLDLLRPQNVSSRPRVKLSPTSLISLASSSCSVPGIGLNLFDRAIGSMIFFLGLRPLTTVVQSCLRGREVGVLLAVEGETTC